MKLFSNAYDAGTDVLGDGLDVTSMIPALAFAKAFTGGGANTEKANKDVVEKALAKQRAEESARRQTLILYATLAGVVSLVGLVVYKTLKKK